MLPLALTPHALVVALRFAARNRQRLPVILGENTGDHDNLSDMIATMSQRSVDGPRYRVGFSANRHGLFQITFRELA